MATETTTKKYSNTDLKEATTAVHSFLKAMDTIRTKYPAERHETIINRIFSDKFGADTNLAAIMMLYKSHQFDVIAGRLHQADHARFQRDAAINSKKAAIIEEYNKMFAQAAQ